MLVPPLDASETLHAYFDFAALGFEEGQAISTVDLDIQESSEIQTAGNETLPERYVNYPVGFREASIGLIDAGEEADVMRIPSNLVTTYYIPEFGATYRSVLRPLAPNVELDSTAHKPDDTYAGDYRACVPAATANSMQWLEEVHKPKLNQGTSLREKLVELSAAMKRQNNAGVMEKEMIEGKLKYIDDHKLPIRVKFQSILFDRQSIASPNTFFRHYARNDNASAKATPTFDWLKKEIDQGEDVEMMYNIFDRDSNKVIGAHAVTLRGYYELGSLKGIYFYDDLVQGRPGGHRYTYSDWVTDSTGTAQLTSISTPKRVRTVRSVVSESYDSTLHFQSPVHEEQLRLLKKRFLKNQTIDTKYEFEYHINRDGTRYLSITTGGWYDSERTVLFNLPITKKGMIVFTPELDAFLRTEGLLKSARTEGDSLLLGLTLSDEPIHRDTFPDQMLKIPIIESETTWPGDALEPNPVATNRVPRSVASFTGNEPEILLLDLPVYDLHGAVNAGGIAAAVSVFRWQAEKHPETFSGLSEETLFALIDEMSGRGESEGMNSEQLIKGKLAGIDSLKIPIRVLYQGRSFTGDLASPDTRYQHSARNESSPGTNAPAWEWIRQKVSEGCGLTLGYGFYAQTGERVGGQWASLSGMVQQGNTKALYLDLDNHPETEGGTVSVFSAWSDTLGYACLGFFTTDTITCWVENAIAQEYDPDMTFELLPSNDLSLRNDLNMIAFRNPSIGEEQIHIRFHANDANGIYTLTIIDPTGSVVYKKAYRFETKGIKTIFWDGRNSEGIPVAKGLYLLRIQTASRKSILKILRQ